MRLLSGRFSFVLSPSSSSGQACRSMNELFDRLSERQTNFAISYPRIAECISSLLRQAGRCRSALRREYPPLNL
jgi:hypothetical protein